MSDCNICNGKPVGEYRCQVSVCHNELNRIRAELKKWEQAARQRSQCVNDLSEKLDEVRKELETSHCQLGLWKEYAELLGAEVDELVPFATMKQWHSSRYEKGLELRKKLGIHNTSKGSNDE